MPAIAGTSGNLDMKIKPLSDRFPSVTTLARCLKTTPLAYLRSTHRRFFSSDILRDKAEQ